MIRVMFLLPALLLTTGCTTPTNQADVRCEDHQLYPRVASGDTSVRIVITLADGQGTPAQRQDQLLAALQGTEFELIRRYENLPSLALAVRRDAFCRLVASPLVRNIQEDTADPPTD